MTRETVFNMNLPTQCSDLVMTKDSKLLKVTLPCCMAGKNIKIKADVVDCIIPLLLSRDFMKRAGMVFYMSSDTVEVFGLSLKLESASSGHYTLPLLPCNVARVEKILLMDAFECPDTVALKLHTQFAHPSTKKLIQDSQRYSSIVEIYWQRH